MSCLFDVDVFGGFLPPPRILEANLFLRCGICPLLIFSPGVHFLSFQYPLLERFLVLIFDIGQTGWKMVWEEVRVKNRLGGNNVVGT